MKQAYLSNVVTLEYSAEKCTGCGRCVEVCPHGVFIMKDKRSAVDNRDRCIECGACALNCAFDAIHVRRGVGCATAMFNGLVTKGNPDLGTCDCGSESSGCC